MPGPRQPLILCMIGHDPFGQLVDQAVANENVDGRRIEVRRLPTSDGAEDCHLAFVRGATGPDTASLLAALGNRPILTITDASAGPQRGMVHFTKAGGRVRFFIDEEAASGRGLGISSRLLALGLGVRQRRP